MGRLARTLVLPAAACLAVAAPAAAQNPVNVGTKVVEVAERDAQATCRTAGGPCQPEASEQAIARFEGSKTHEALVFQHRLGDDVGMADAPWAATHNSYNSIDEMGPALSTTDSNHQIGMVEQLRIGIRSLEIDIHKFAGRNVVCHARGANEGHAGCSVERELGPVLEPIARWVDDNPGQVLMLYLEDHMTDAAGYDAAAKTVKDTFGDALYAPRPGAGTGCQVLPSDMTREDVLAAGAQVFVVSDCGPGTGWRTVAFDWGPMHDEAQPQEFQAATCGPFARARLSRFYEDSTGLSYGISEMGGDGEPGKLTPVVTAAMARCGIDHIGFDQLVPEDGRLAALVWSWGSGQPATDDGSCAVQRDGDGRWQAGSCVARRRAACRRSDGSWLVTTSAVDLRRARVACRARGAAFAVPRTGWENELLERAAGGDPVLLGLVRVSGAWRAVDER
jgi:hypothetical protein